MSSVALAAALILLATPHPAAAQEVDVQADIPYTFSAGEDRLLDAYLPGTRGPHPAVVWIHGGRWAAGDKTQDADLVAALAGEGFAVFSVNYRLVKEGTYPAALEDVQAAVEWIRDNADEYEVDPERIGAIGVSAGAHLAGLLATVGEGPLTEDTRISAAVSLSGPMDLVTAADDTGNLGKAVQNFLDCVPPACTTVAEVASPIANVDPTDAPMLLFNSLEEIIPVEQASSMVAALEEAGVTSEAVLVPGAEHASSMVGGGKPGAPDVAEAYTRFLTRHVAGGLELDATPTATPSATPVAGPDSPSPLAAPGPAPSGGSTLPALLFGLLALGTLGGIVTWWLRKRHLERHPY